MTEKPSIVRPATPDDEEKLFDLLCLAYRENAPYTMSDKKVREMIATATRDRGPAIVGVIDNADGTGLAASVGGAFSQWWYTDDWHIEEFWNFVHPDYRVLPPKYRDNGEKQPVSYAAALISYMKWISENMDMPLHMGVLTSKRMEAKIRLYQRQMPQVGAAFAYNMKTGNGPIAEEIANG